MPRVKLGAKRTESDMERTTRLFRAALRYSMDLRMEDAVDVARQIPMGLSTFYLRMRDASHLTVRELLCLRDRFTDRQLCEMFGVPYHGATEERAS